MKSLALCALLLAGCGGDDVVAKMDSGNGSGSNKVVPATCSGTPKQVTVTDGVDAYMPMTTTIAVGDMVEFKTSVTHNVIPGLTSSDPGLKVDFSEDACLKFTTAGTFNFLCQNHGFTGSIVVN